MATLASYLGRDTRLKRKALTGVVLAGDISATMPSTMSGSDSSLITKPTGFNDLGYTTDDGVTGSRSVESTDITAWQDDSPIRSDVTSDVETFTVSFHETNAYVIGLYYGVARSSLVPDATSGEVKILKPATAEPIYYRMLVVTRDTSDFGDFYIITGLPRVKVDDWDDQQYGKTDDGIVYGVTLKAFPDATLGYSKATWFAGPGMKGLATAMRMPTS